MSHTSRPEDEEEEVEDKDKDGGDKPQSILEKITQQSSPRSRNTAAVSVYRC